MPSYDPPDSTDVEWAAAGLKPDGSPLDGGVSAPAAQPAAADDTAAETEVASGEEDAEEEAEEVEESE